MIAVEVDRIEKRYGRVRAIASMSARIEGPELTLLRGANGAGKSTLLRVLAGLTRPSRGTIRVLGADPFREGSFDVRARVGYLGPEPGLYGELSVRENLRFSARLYGRSQADVESQIEALDLGVVADRPVQILSFGFRRRAGLARALLSQPQLLLLDEPWNGLDERAGRVLARTLREHRGAGRTALVAAHSVGEHAELFDRTLWLSNGRIEPEDPGEHRGASEPESQ